MAVNKVVYGTTVLVDLTEDTVTADTLMQGYTAHDKSGALITGTATGGALVVTLSDVNGVWTPDKTIAEIADAYGDGRDIAVRTNNVDVIADGFYDDEDYNALCYTVDYFDYDTNVHTTQWYIYDSNGVTDDGNAVYYLTRDATAGPSDVASGKVFYNANGKQTGTATPSTPSLQSKTATPTTSQQVITADSGYDGLSQVTVSAMPSGTAGTPTATKGTVSNHSVSVTPSVTNTTGYITGGTKSGTAVTVSASELVSGSETKTANGIYDVTNLASLVVNIPFVTYHTSTSEPTSSQGSNGDIWLVTA